MDIKLLLKDPISFADVLLANFVQGNKDAEKFIVHLTENLPAAQKARTKNVIAANQPTPSVQNDDQPVAMMRQKMAKKKKAFSFDFLRKLIPFGIGAGGFVVGFFIVLPILSLIIVPIFGFGVGLIVFGGSIWYAKIWKDENFPAEVASSVSSTHGL